MKKIIVLGYIVLLLFVGCSDKIDFVEEGVFVKLEPYSAAEGTYLDHFPKIITISNDGKIKVKTKEVKTSYGEVEMKVGEDVPTIEKKISQKEVKGLKRTIENNNFFYLPNDVTDYSVMDGDGSVVTVYLEDGEKSVGGENPSNEDYLAITEAIFDKVGDEYKSWEEETREYLHKLNGE